MNKSPWADTLHAVQAKEFAPVAAIGAGVANTVVQARVVLPFNYKIRYVAVDLTAIDAVAGLDLFNLVVGTGAYTNTAASLAPNDNRDTNGIATNVAVAGNSVFGADVPFNAANTQVQGSGWIALATAAGGQGIFVPPNYDAVYPRGVPMTLRVVTVAATGSISNLAVVMGIVPVDLRAAVAGAPGQTIVLPGVDY